VRRPTARSLILDLLSTVPRGSVEVGRLLHCGRLFGIAGGALRVALMRLCREGRVECPARGRYRLGAAASAVWREVLGWRELERDLLPWQGGWIGVHIAGLAHTDRARARARRRALSLLGFHALARGLWIRPDNRRGGREAIHERLLALGLDAQAPVLSIAGLDGASAARARSLWDGAGLVRAYRAMSARLRASAARLPSLPRDQARVESFLLGGAAIRQLVLDPRLPEPLVPARERRALLDAMRSYDELGRACWAGALVPERTRPRCGPADLGGLEVAVAGR
jgi:phenylacetic acid degradation operon negative regulatory protein